MDYHDSHERIHKLHDCSRSDSEHCYHMGLDSMDYAVLVRVRLLLKQLNGISVYD